MGLINEWHTKLSMPKHDLAWHKQDIVDELKELEEARGFICRWSELSDVVYTYTRAKWSWHEGVTFPFGRLVFYWGSLYMFPKYSLRWKFFNKLGKRFNRNLNITEVRNPKKIEKLKDIALKYNLDTVRFTEEANKLIKGWYFLK